MSYWRYLCLIRCDYGPQLVSALEQISKSDSGILVYLRQEGRVLV